MSMPSSKIKSAKPATPKGATAVPFAAPARKGKATVLALHQTKGGKVYQVLAPAAKPKHLTGEDIDRMLDAMVTAR